jgi:hypothetical protein
VRSLVLLIVLASACNDVRGFEGTWTGPRVGSARPLDVNVAPNATATLEIDQVDLHTISGELSIDGVVANAPFSSIAGAEADVLSGITFDGSPSRVYLTFVDIPDGNGQALAVIALYDDKRVEVRVLRGGTQALYGIFALTQGES